MSKRGQHDIVTRSVERDIPQAGANNESPPDILKLDIDCFEELFDFLCLKELFAVGRTCKRLNQMAGHVFKLNYPDVIAILEKGRVRIEGIRINTFIPFIRNIFIPDATLPDIQFIASHRFYSLKHLRLSSIKLSASSMEGIKTTLAKLETVALMGCTESTDLFEDFLRFCVNIKRLMVTYVWQSSHSTTWLLQKYPMLEHCRLILQTVGTVDELKTFLEQNPNLKSISLSSSDV